MEELRSAFTCPLSKQFMHDPVIVVSSSTFISGDSYERSALEQWIQSHADTSTHFVPNVALCKLIKGLENHF